MILLLITLYFVIGLIALAYDAMQLESSWSRILFLTSNAFQYVFAWPYYLWKRYA